MLDITRSELEAEIAEKATDLQVFTQARDLIWRRCVEVRDTSKSRLMPVHEWAGTHALMNSFDVFINNMQRLLDELKEFRDNTKEPPRLRIVRSEDEQGPAGTS